MPDMNGKADTPPRPAPGRIAVRLSAVQETLLIPLYARAQETRLGGDLRDTAAVHVVDGLDADFRRFEGLANLSGVTVRTLLLDAWTHKFADEHPGGTVVEPGAGLSTRFERLAARSTGVPHWLDVDLPEVAELRRAFFPDTERRRAVAAALTDAAWTDAVLRLPAPYFLLAEAVLAFLPEAAVRCVLTLIATRLPGAVLALDTVGAELAAEQSDPGVLGRLLARTRWSCDRPWELETWCPGVTLERSVDFAGLPPKVRGRLRPEHRRSLDSFVRQRSGRVRAYRINGYRIGSPVVSAVSGEPEL